MHLKDNGIIKIKTYLVYFIIVIMNKSPVNKRFWPVDSEYRINCYSWRLILKSSLYKNKKNQLSCQLQMYLDSYNIQERTLDVGIFVSPFFYMKKMYILIKKKKCLSLL